MEEQEIERSKMQILGENNKDTFVAIWVNRNAKRKRPSDVLKSWQLFLEKEKAEKGEKKNILIMHTDPKDSEGPDLISVVEMLGIKENVYFSTERLEFEKINVLYNISDVCLNISFAEGFGLGTLEAMQAGTPIVAIKTGGLTRQVVDHRDGSENGVALPVETQSLVGSQFIPYIYEDYVSCETVANGIKKIYDLDKTEKEKLSKKVQKYAHECFNLEDTIKDWDKTFDKTIKNWKKEYKRWEIIEI